MKKMNLIYLIVCFMIFMTLSGCSQNGATEATDATDAIETTQPNTTQTAIETYESPQNDKQKNLFEIKDGVLVRYWGGFEKEAEVILPSEVKKIGKRAFALTKEEKRKPPGQLATLRLSISKDVTLAKYAFNNMGPMVITFEKGRTCIEERAFFGSTRTGVSSEVILPDSVVTLEKYCFSNSGTGSFLCVQLGNGIKNIKEGALAGVSVDRIPDSVIHIGKEAFCDWGYLPNDLPEGVQTLGSHCIDITDGKIKIPSTVKKIAPNAVWWLEDSEHHGYIVSKDNPYFKNDSNGWLYSKDGKILYYATLWDTNNVLPKGVEQVYKEGLLRSPDESPEEYRSKIKGIDRVKVR